MVAHGAIISLRSNASATTSRTHYSKSTTPSEWLIYLMNNHVFLIWIRGGKFFIFREIFAKSRSKAVHSRKKSSWSCSRLSSSSPYTNLLWTTVFTHQESISGWLRVYRALGINFLMRKQTSGTDQYIYFLNNFSSSAKAINVDGLTLDYLISVPSRKFNSSKWFLNFSAWSRIDDEQANLTCASWVLRYRIAVRLSGVFSRRNDTVSWRYPTECEALRIWEHG